MDCIRPPARFRARRRDGRGDGDLRERCCPWRQNRRTAAGGTAALPPRRRGPRRGPSARRGFRSLVLLVLALLAAAPACSAATATPTSCPLDQEACAFAAALNRWLQSGDDDSIIARLAPERFTCPGPVAQGLGGPYPLCEGSTPGEERSGYPSDNFSEGTVQSASQYRGLLGYWRAHTEASLADGDGPGALRLVTLACTAAGGSVDCGHQFLVAFSALWRFPQNPEAVRMVFVFWIARGVGPGEERIVGTGAGALSQVPAGMVRGGRAPSHVPLGDVEFFPWVPPAVAAASPTPASGARPLTSAVVQPGEQVEVAVYGDSPPTAAHDCSDLLLEMVPASAAGSLRGTTRPCTVGNDFFRYHYARASGGPLYLARVDVLILAKATLPVPTPGTPEPYPLCREIAPHLVPVAEDPGRAAYLSLCEVEPLARGQQIAAPLLIWARVPSDSPVKRFPPDVPCWQLSRFLGAPTEGASFNVPCALDAGLLPAAGARTAGARSSRLGLTVALGGFAFCAAVALAIAVVRRLNS